MPALHPAPLRSHLSEIRRERLEKAVKLYDAATAAGLSLARASEIERYPETARPGELEALRYGIDLVALELSNLEGETR